MYNYSKAERFIKYILGLTTMAFGVLLMKKAALGITPITSVPLALSEITTHTIGEWTIVFHIVCIIGIIVIKRKVELDTILMFPVGIFFGYLIDFLLWIFTMEPHSIITRAILLICGIPVSGLGVALINDANLMLPSPDGFLRTISSVFNIKYHRVKITGDCIWIGSSIIIELTQIGHLQAVGVGSVASAVFVGMMIKFWNKGLARFNALTHKEKKNDLSV